MIDKIKDPQEDLDYTWDFAGLLASGETIASYSFPSTPAALTLHDITSTTNAVTAYLGAGGTAGTRYEVPCRIVTNASPPRTFERSIRFKMISL